MQFTPYNTHTLYTYYELQYSTWTINYDSYIHKKIQDNNWQCMITHGKVLNEVSAMN